MFAGTALSVRLFVYAGLSLFIISRPYLYMVVCVLYVYNLTWGGLKMAKMGESQTGSVSFLSSWKRSPSNLRKVAPLSLIYFGRFFFFFFLIPPCLFTVHVRPVLSPCQAGNTCYIFTCVSNSYIIDNIINTICAYTVYNIICSTAIYVGDHRILLDRLFVRLHNKIGTFVILQTSIIIFLNTP